MKNFEVDVSGEELLNKNYTICIADNDGIIKGFKFNEKLIGDLCSRYGQGIYRYKKSSKGKATFKVRIYCIIVYYLIKSLNLKDNISLALCRDFIGWENEIKDNLKYFAKNLGIDLEDKITFTKLSPESNAHKYAYLMRIDNKNKMSTYVNITVKEIEKWLKK